LVDVGLLYIFTNFFGLWFFIPLVFPYLAGMLTNYSLNKYFNFQNKSKKNSPSIRAFCARCFNRLGSKPNPALFVGRVCRALVYFSQVHRGFHRDVLELLWPTKN